MLTRRTNLELGVIVALLALAVVASSACSAGTDAASTTVSSVASATGSTADRMPDGQTGRPTPPSGGFPPGMRGSTTTTDGTTSTTAPTATSSTAVQTTTTMLPEGTYGDGIYLVGTDIESGLYKGTATGEAAHWEISRDANGESFVVAGDPVGQFYVKVVSGRYLRLSGAAVTKASTTAADPLLSSEITSGTYRVEYDIPAGWYKGTVNGRMGYWEICSDANGQYLVASDYASGPFSVELESGQYVTLRGVTIGQ